MQPIMAEQALQEEWEAVVLVNPRSPQRDDRQRGQTGKQ